MQRRLQRACAGHWLRTSQAQAVQDIVLQQVVRQLKAENAISSHRWLEIFESDADDFAATRLGLAGLGDIEFADGNNGAGQGCVFDGCLARDVDAPWCARSGGGFGATATAATAGQGDGQYKNSQM